jgi:hypothetical protein
MYVREVSAHYPIFFLLPQPLLCSENKEQKKEKQSIKERINNTYQLLNETK